MDDLTYEDWVLLATAASVSRKAHERVHREAVAQALDRSVSKHYRSMANKDANWAAEQVNRLSRLEARMQRMLAEMREREAA